MGDDVGGPGVDVHVERIGSAALDMHQRPAGHVGDEGRAVQLAGSLQAEGLGAVAAGRLGGGDHALEAHAALLVDQMDLPVAQDEVLDQRQLGRLGALGSKGPVVAAGLVRIELEARMVDVHQRQLDVARQQRQEFHLHGGAAEVGGLAMTAHPLRIADLEAADRGRGRPGEQVHLEMADDPHLALGSDRQIVGERIPEPVPGEEGEEHRHRDGEHRPDAGCENQPPAPAAVGEGALDIRAHARTPSLQPGGRCTGPGVVGEGTGHGRSPAAHPGERPAPIDRSRSGQDVAAWPSGWLRLLQRLAPIAQAQCKLCKRGFGRDLCNVVSPI